MPLSSHADHVGSFLRPQSLLHARLAHEAGTLHAAGLRAAEDDAIREILAVQEAAGLEVFTDGEYRRAMWMTGLPAATDGFVPGRMVMVSHWRKAGAGGPPQDAAPGGMPPMVIGGRLRPRRRITGDESAFLRANAPGPCKITMPSPSWYLHGYRPGVSDRAYPTLADALRDLAGIVHDEAQALIEEGVTYVQIDSIRYVFDFTDEARRAGWRERGIDPDAAIRENIEADNAVVAGLKRQGVTCALHMCRGNNRSYWFAEGGYDRIAEQAFAELNYDRFLLEHDSARAGGFAPLRYVPAGKTVVLGLISTKTPVLESKDDLKRRIHEAATFVPLENLALSPQCGFASVAGGNELSWDDQQRKLELLVETAREVWG